MAKVKIKQIKGTIDRPSRQLKTLQALGLGRLHDTVEHEETPQIAGMVNKVLHLVQVERL